MKLRIQVKSVPSVVDDEAGGEGKEKKPKKKTGKRKKEADGDEGEVAGDGAGMDADTEPTPLQKRKKKSDVPAKKTTTGKAKRHAREMEMDTYGLELPDDVVAKSVFLDLEYWNKQRLALDGTFDSARENLARNGKWELPSLIPKERFVDVAKETLARMTK